MAYKAHNYRRIREAGVPYVQMDRYDIDDQVNFVGCNDKLAIKVIQRLKEAGVRIPEDVSIMGFDDWAGHSQPIGLTTIRQNFLDLGQAAGHLLIGVMNGSLSCDPLKVLTGVSVVMRDTVGLSRGD